MTHQNKSIEQSENIAQINRNNRSFINNSIFDNDNKLLCIQCNKN